ncbi:MAG: NAD(P)H-dependent oxidoreductase subunit E [Clostridia bacterium]|nr:NAD(P)H-dependent oxidoreductase subunit E [Clostridia bacterium]
MADKHFDLSVVKGILEKYPKDEVSTIAILQDVQEHYNYLPREVFPYIAREIGVSEAKLYGVATFYENFSLEPKGKYVIRCCDGTACHVRGSIPLLERLRAELGLSESKKTTDDLNFTVETVSCLGACGLAPAMTVNGTVYGAMTPDKAGELLKELKAEIEKEGAEA